MVSLPLIGENVSAYIDPGAGSLIIQVLIASFLGGLFLIKVFWGKVKAFVSLRGLGLGKRLRLLSQRLDFLIGHALGFLFFFIDGIILKNSQDGPSEKLLLAQLERVNLKRGLKCQ